MENQFNKSQRTEKFRLSDLSDQESGPAPFTVPDDYFKELQAWIYLKTNALAGLEKADAVEPFEVPENYFESLPLKVRAKISSGHGNPVRNEWVAALLRPQISLSMIAIFFLIFFVTSTFRTQVIEVPSNNLRESLTDNGYDLMLLDESMLIEEFMAMDNPESGENLTDPYVQYLIENNIELSQIEQLL